MVVRTRGVARSLALVLLGLAACGGDDAPTTGAVRGCAVVEGGVVTVVAKDLAWDHDCIRARAGEAFTVVVENEDDGVNHDFQLALDDEVLRTPLEAGPVVQRLEVPALDAGEHPYLCDVHPNMTGQLEVVD